MNNDKTIVEKYIYYDTNGLKTDVNRYVKPDGDITIHIFENGNERVLNFKNGNYNQFLAMYNSKTNKIGRIRSYNGKYDGSNFKKLYISTVQGTITRKEFESYGDMIEIVSKLTGGNVAFELANFLYQMTATRNKNVEYTNFSEVLYEIRFANDNQYYCHLHDVNAVAYDKNGRQLFIDNYQYESIGY